MTPDGNEDADATEPADDSGAILDVLGDAAEPLRTSAVREAIDRSPGWTRGRLQSLADRGDVVKDRDGPYVTWSLAGGQNTGSDAETGDADGEDAEVSADTDESATDTDDESATDTGEDDDSGMADADAESGDTDGSHRSADGGTPDGAEPDDDTTESADATATTDRRSRGPAIPETTPQGGGSARTLVRLAVLAGVVLIGWRLLQRLRS